MNKYDKRITLNNTGILDSLTAVRPDGKVRLSFRGLRWAVILIIQALFILSYRADVQVLEGTLVGSRFLGFHLIDPFISLEYMVAYHAFPRNLLIGTLTVIAFYLVFGRAFCSWVCPYGLISEIGEKLHAKLLTKRVIKEHYLPTYLKYAFWVFFLLLCFLTGYLVFEMVNLVGIINRMVIYTVWLSVTIAVLVFGIEVFYSRRFWCRSVCPIGATYGVLNKVSAVKVQYNGVCDNCGSCKSVCHVPHVLEMTGRKIEKPVTVTNTDCTMCGRCVDVCHNDTLKFTNRLKRLV